MSIVVVIVSGFSAWLVLRAEYYQIDVQSEEVVAFVYSDCLGLGEKKKTRGCHNISYVSDYGVIQLKLYFNLKLVTAITRGQKVTAAGN